MRVYSHRCRVSKIQLERFLLVGQTDAAELIKDA